MENIRSYTAKKVEFDEGITLLWGDIGSGKSTLLQSIEFALFGAGSEVTPQSLLRAHAKRGVIKVMLGINKKHVVIERVLEKKQHGRIENKDNYLSINGLREKLPPSVLKYRVFRLLGYPLSLIGRKEKYLPYRYTVYTPQEQMKEILLTSVNDRLSLLRSIFNVDKYQRVVENAKKLREAMNKQIAEMQGETKGLEELVKKAEDYKKLQHELITKIKQKELKKENLEKELSLVEEKIKTLEALENEIKALEQEIKLRKEKFFIVKKSYEEQKERVKQLVKEAQELDTVKLEKEKQKVKEKLIKEKAALDEIKKQLEKAEKERDELLNEKEKLIKEKAALDEIKKQLEKAEKERDELLNEKEKLIKEKAALDEIKKQLEKAEKERDELLNEKEKLIKEKAALERELTIKKKQTSHLLSLSTCPTCKQVISHNHKVKLEEEFKSYEESLSTKIKFINENIMSIDFKLKNLESLIAEKKQRIEQSGALHLLKDVNTRLKRKDEEIFLLKKRLNTISIQSRDLDSLDKKMNENSKLLAELKKNHEAVLSLISNYEKQIILIDEALAIAKRYLNERQKLVSLEKDLEKAEHDFKEAEKKQKLIELKKQEAKKAEEVKHKYKQVKNDYLAVVQSISMLRGKVDELEKQLSSVNEEIATKQKIAEKKQRIEQIVHFLEAKFIPLMDAIEKRVMSNINMQFNAYFREWFEQLLEHTDLRASIDETFTPKIEQEGGYVIDYVHLSGGEKTSVALAYRLALNKIMNQLIDTLQTRDLLILDEPTDGFSSEQIQNMRELLEKLNLKQIIIVSHEEMVKDIADHIIKLKKINGATQIYE